MSVHVQPLIRVKTLEDVRQYLGVWDRDGDGTWTIEEVTPDAFKTITNSDKYKYVVNEFDLQEMIQNINAASDLKWKPVSQIEENALMAWLETAN
jgi:hypothetical protein